MFQEPQQSLKFKMLTEEIKQKIENSLKDSKVRVLDTSQGHEEHNPTGAHIAVEVISKKFEGKSLIEQHQIINNILEEELKEQVHALQIRTRTE